VLGGSSKKIERLYVYPKASYWPALVENITLKAGSKVPLQIIDLTFIDCVRTFYGGDDLNLWRMGGFVNEAASEYLMARNTGRACRLTRENVRYQNSLQVLNAERFVISSVNEFADAEDIVTRDPDARVGLRVNVM
jgi:hypothetical protein